LAGFDPAEGAIFIGRHASRVSNYVQKYECPKPSLEAKRFLSHIP
jgi:hypothetical protein